MKKIIFLFAFGIISSSLFAQDETVKKLKEESSKTIKKDADTLQEYWRKGGIYSLNLAQGSLSNWSAGGDDFSLAITSYLNLYSYFKEGRKSWDNTLDFSFGYVNTTSLGGRKNDDRLDFLSKYGLGVSDKWSVSLLFNFRSQIAQGYTYPNQVKTFSSAFLSPANIVTSLGMDYKPGPNFSFFISPVSARWVIVKDDTLSAQGAYGVEPGSHSKFEFGAFASANYIKEFSPSLQYRGRLDLFSNYRSNPQNIDVFMTNVFSVKLSKLLSANWNIDFIYDDDVKIFGKAGRSPALQIKSLLGLGLQVKF